MGNCINSKKSGSNIMNRSGVGFLKSNDSVITPLKFIIELDKIKCKNLTHSDSYLNFNFHNQKIISTTLITDDRNPHWKNREIFEFLTDTMNLKSSLLTISIRNKTEKELSKIILNLYDVSIGPIYHDISLENKHSSIKGRIAFNLKMFQMVKLIIEPLKILCQFNEIPNEKEYNFSLKFINAEGREEITDNSENITNNFSLLGGLEREKTQSLYNEENIEEENYNVGMNEGDKKNIRNHFVSKSDLRQNQKLHSIENFPQIPLKLSNTNLAMLTNPIKKNTLIEKDKKPIEIPNKREILWDFNDHNDQVIPILDLEVKSNDLSQSCIQFLLWSPKNEEKSPHGIKVENFNLDQLMDENEKDENENEIKVIENKLIGECYVNMNRLFKEDIHAFDMDVNLDYVVSNKEKQLNEKLWCHGVLIGHLKGIMKVVSNPFVKQAMLGVRTEKGIEKASSLFYRNEAEKGAKNSLPSEVKAIIQCKEMLLECMFKLSKKNEKIDEKSISAEITIQSKKIEKILTKSNKDTLVCFLYRNKSDLIQTQNLMIELADQILQWADEGNETLKALYYNILKLLMNRGEFDLANIGFDENHNFLLTGAKNASFKQLNKEVLNKMEVGLKYQEILYKLLDKVLYKLNLKGCNNEEKNFVDNFCAIAYFKIPEFRSKLLDCVVKGENYNQTILEWRGTEWNLDDPISDDKRDKHLLNLFDWEQHFYQFLKTDPKGEKNYKLLNEILNKEEWQNRIKKRGVAFFKFLKEWSRYVKKKVVLNENFPFQDLMGYRVLLKALLLELKIKNIYEYSDALKEASLKMLYNEKLIHTLVSIAYNKTKFYNIYNKFYHIFRVHDSKAVFYAFDMINSWFKQLREEKKKIYTTFDYDFFFTGIRYVFETDHAVCIGKCLWMIYNNFILFSAEFQQEICEFIFKFVFFRFFMHWSYTVRLVFHHFMLYRLYHLHRDVKTDVPDEDGLNIELMLFHQKKKIAQEVSTIKKEHIINDLINVQYFNMMTIIEKAKSKLEQEQKRLENEEKELEDKIFFGGGGDHQNLLAKLKKKKQNKNNKINLSPNFTSPKISNDKAKMNLADFKLKNREASFLLINTSMDDIKSDLKTSSMVLRNDSFETKLDKNPIKNDSFVYSVNEFKQEVKKAEKKYSTYETAKTPPRDLKRRKSEILTSPTKKQNSNEFNEVNATPVKRLKKPFIINKKIKYYDSKDDKYVEIPAENIKYLITAYHEFEIMKKNYVKWFHNQKDKLFPDSYKKLTKEDYLRMEVPEVSVEIMKDEVEMQEEADEW